MREKKHYERVKFVYKKTKLWKASSKTCQDKYWQIFTQKVKQIKNRNV